MQISSLQFCIFQIFIYHNSVTQPITYSKCFQPTLMTYQAYSCLHFYTHLQLIFNSVMPWNTCWLTFDKQKCVFKYADKRKLQLETQPQSTKCWYIKWYSATSLDLHWSAEHQVHCSLNSGHLASEHIELYSSDNHHKLSLYHQGTVGVAANSTPRQDRSQV